MQNGNSDQHQNTHRTSSDKGLYMSGVWWLNLLQFRRFVIPVVDAETKKNNKDNTGTKKTIKDSEVIRNLLIIIIIIFI